MNANSVFHKIQITFSNSPADRVLPSTSDAQTLGFIENKLTPRSITNGEFSLPGIASMNCFWIVFGNGNYYLSFHAFWHYTNQKLWDFFSFIELMYQLAHNRNMPEASNEWVSRIRTNVILFTSLLATFTNTSRNEWHSSIEQNIRSMHTGITTQRDPLH